MSNEVEVRWYRGGWREKKESDEAEREEEDGEASGDQERGKFERCRLWRLDGGNDSSEEGRGERAEMGEE